MKENVLGGRPGNRIVFVSLEPLGSDREVKSWGKVYRVPDDCSAAWFFFIDDQPEANWGHACRYVFVDAASGTWHAVDGLTPPDSLDRMVIIHPGSNAK